MSNAKKHNQSNALMSPDTKAMMQKINDGLHKNGTNIKQFCNDKNVSLHKTLQAATGVWKTPKARKRLNQLKTAAQAMD